MTEKTAIPNTTSKSNSLVTKYVLENVRKISGNAITKMAIPQMDTQANISVPLRVFFR